jgi:hypothetical protein
MSTDWRFEDPAGAWFEEDVERYAPAVRPVLERALLEILDDPLASPRAVVRGDIVYIKRLQSFLTPDEVVPALLLVYTVARAERLIRKLALFRAAEVAPTGGRSTDRQIYAALERMVETAIKRAKRREH